MTSWQMDDCKNSNYCIEEIASDFVNNKNVECLSQKR